MVVIQSVLGCAVLALAASKVVAFASTSASMARSASRIKESAATEYDLVTIGGGSAGLTAAKFAGSTCSKATLIIEQSKLGGDCTWTGCVPSKSLIASAKAAQATRRQLLQTSSSSAYRPNWSQVQAMYREQQQSIYDKDDSPGILRPQGVTTLQGTAKLISEDTIEVELPSVEGSDEKRIQIIKAKQGIIVCTGATPRRPTESSSLIPGLDSVKYVTYEEVWDLEELPKRITVVGGGPIGCELAQALSRLGCAVTIVASSSRLLPNDDPRAGEVLYDIFTEDEKEPGKDGIRVCLGQRLSRVESIGASGSHKGILDDETTEVEGDLILLSIGRVPNVKGFGLEELGVDFDGKTGGVVVDKQLRTTNKKIYAAGDCTGDRQFTHYAGFQGAIAARNILLPLSDPGVVSNDVPATTFTTPEVASVGLTEASAIAEFGENRVAVASCNLEKLDRAICDGNTRGFFKVVYHARNGKILGATIMCPGAGDIISEISVAMKVGMKFTDLAKVIHPYPSYAIALQLLSAEVYYADLKKFIPLYNVLKWLGL